MERGGVGTNGGLKERDGADGDEECRKKQQCGKAKGDGMCSRDCWIKKKEEFCCKPNPKGGGRQNAFATYTLRGGGPLHQEKRTAAAPLLQRKKVRIRGANGSAE